jgi:hypothetical protein
MADKPFTGWKLDRADRARLLEQFPPRYPGAVADHVTHKPGDAPMPQAEAARIIGRADDGEGVEAMVVEVAGHVRRADGGVHHITWSLGPGREAKESNAVIAEKGWVALMTPVDVAITPVGAGEPDAPR